MQNLCHSIKHISRNIFPDILDLTVTHTIIYEHQESDSENLRTSVFLDRSHLKTYLANFLRHSYKVKYIENVTKMK